MSIQNKSRSELIERALDGQPAEVKARVLAIVVRYNIDVRNEFFLIFVAIGHLLAIVEIAPENWRSLFDEFERKLDEWSEQNLRTLAAIHQQGEAAERMSQSFLRLTDSTKVSTTKTKELQQDLIALSRTLTKLNGSLGSVQQDSKANRSQIAALNDKLDRSQSQLSRVNDQMEWMWSINAGLSAGIVGCILIFGWSLWQQQAVANEQSKRLGWLLEKATRQECVTGIKPASDPDCQQYL